MTQPPKEKAKELVDKCYYQIEDATAGMFEEGVDYVKARSIAAKQCALIAVQFAEKKLIEYGNQTFELQNMDATLRDLDTLKTEIQNL